MADLRYAFRVLARTPVVSLIVMASLALGIGANMAIFSIIHQVLLRTMPVQAPEELVFFYQPGPAQGRTSTDDRDMPAFHHPMFRDLQEKPSSFMGIAGFRDGENAAESQLDGGLRAHLVRSKEADRQEVAERLEKMRIAEDAELVETQSRRCAAPLDLRTVSRVCLCP